MRAIMFVAWMSVMLPSFVGGQNLKLPKNINKFKEDCVLIDSVEIEFTDTEHLNNIINNLTLLNDTKKYVVRKPKNVYEIRKGVLKQLFIRHVQSDSLLNSFYGFGKVEVNFGRLLKGKFPANTWIEVKLVNNMCTISYWINDPRNYFNGSSLVKEFVLEKIKKEFKALLDHTQERLIALKRID